MRAECGCILNVMKVSGNIWGCRECGQLLINPRRGQKVRISGGETLENDGHLRQTVDRLPENLTAWQGEG